MTIAVLLAQTIDAAIHQLGLNLGELDPAVTAYSQ
jgi:hypothetical protein